MINFCTYFSHIFLYMFHFISTVSKLKSFFYLLLIYNQVPTEPQKRLKDLQMVICIQGKNLVVCFAVNRAKICLTQTIISPSLQIALPYELMGLLAGASTPAAGPLAKTNTGLSTWQRTCCRVGY